MSTKDTHYILGIDQSTQGTKFVLVDQEGQILCRHNLSHAQLVNELGYISHDMSEIYRNILQGVRDLLHSSGVDPGRICALALCNQRETTVLWDDFGTPCDKAIVWQCGRARNVIGHLEEDVSVKKKIYETTGLPLSPYFPAAKMKWLLSRHQGSLKGFHLGTVDSYLIYRLTEGQVFATDYSNASRTQLFDLRKMAWDEELCNLFGIPLSCLPEVRDSNAVFGETDLRGILDHKIPIHAVLGDSHAALYAQGCHRAGMLKVTYGTGSSMMLNTGGLVPVSRNGLSSTIAWKLGNEICYALEGNINDAGASISWLQKKAGLSVPQEDINRLCLQADPGDSTVLIPAFSGLSAPHWRSDVKAAFLFMGRGTGRAELLRATVDSIANQVADVYEAMEKDYQHNIPEIRADGGPTANPYLMGYQAGCTCGAIRVSNIPECSVLGTVYAAGQALEMFDRDIFDTITYKTYHSSLSPEEIRKKRAQWRSALHLLLGNQESEVLYT